MRTKLLALAVMTALAGSALAAEGIEKDTRKGHETKRDNTKSLSSKASQSAGGITLLNQGLAMAAPLPSSFIRDSWYSGKSRKALTKFRTGEPPFASFAQMRISELEEMRTSDQDAKANPFALWVAEQYKACKGDDACIWHWAYRETVSYAIQSVSEPQQPIFAAYDLPGVNKDVGNRIVDKDWPNYWAQAGVLAYAARAILTATFDAAPSSQQAMSLADRRVALAKAFYLLPDAVIDGAFLKPNQLSMTTFGYTAKQPLELTIRYDGKETSVLSIDSKAGMSVASQGGVLLGGGKTVDGIDFTYTGEASDTTSLAVSDTSSSGQSTRKSVVTPEKAKRRSF